MRRSCQRSALSFQLLAVSFSQVAVSALKQSRDRQGAVLRSRLLAALLQKLKADR
jgi:hypothetical protein